MLTIEKFPYSAFLSYFDGWSFLPKISYVELLLFCVSATTAYGFLGVSQPLPSLHHHLRHHCYPHRWQRTKFQFERTGILFAAGSPDSGEGIGVGIDLGTTNSAIAFLNEDNKPCIIEIPNNGRTIKSIVAFDSNDDESFDGNFSHALVGNDAIQWERQNKETAYRHVKRVIGTGTTFLSQETKEVVPHLVLNSGDNDDEDNNLKKKKGNKKRNRMPTLDGLLQDANENPTMLHSLNGKAKQVVSPETISSCILQKLFTVASEYTSQPVTRAVIGVPAYFNDAQREATIRAANACGVEKVKLLREPEAAALAYGIGKDSSEDEELVLVFDLGGGTYDVSVLLVEKGLTEIVCTSGNAQLGGTNFDAKIAKHLARVVEKCCVSEAPDEMFLRAAESIRIYLSNNKIAHLALPCTQAGWLSLGDASSVITMQDSLDVTANEEGRNSTHIFYQLSRKDMERLCVDEFQELLRPVREVSVMAGALLPGDARPGIVEAAIEVESMYSEAERFYNKDADDPTVHGQDSILNTQATEVRQIEPEDLKKTQQRGRKKARETAKQERKFRAESRRVQAVKPDVKIEADGISGRPISRIVLVGGATRMPTIGRIIYSLTGVVPQRTVDPDEAVAIGCAIHVGVLDGKQELGVVLNPIQAALLRAMVEKERREGKLDYMLFDDGEDDEEFSTVEFL